MFHEISFIDSNRYYLNGSKYSEYQVILVVTQTVFWYKFLYKFTLILKNRYHR